VMNTGLTNADPSIGEQAAMMSIDFLTSQYDPPTTSNNPPSALSLRRGPYIRMNAGHTSIAPKPAPASSSPAPLGGPTRDPN
jgi:hypothetical protein